MEEAASRVPQGRRDLQAETGTGMPGGGDRLRKGRTEARTPTSIGRSDDEREWIGPWIGEMMQGHLDVGHMRLSWRRMRPRSRGRIQEGLIIEEFRKLLRLTMEIK